MTHFAEMTTAMNAAIVDFLADAEADFGNGVVVSGLFRDLPVESFGVISGSKPSFEGLTEVLGAVVVDDTVSIKGVEYVVAEIPRPRDGMTTLILETA